MVLLISDNPATAEPRRVTTRTDGTVSVPLRPGNYTVESDRPITFQGRAYQWTMMVDVTAGAPVALDLTAANAEITAVAEIPATTAAKPVSRDSATLLSTWQHRVVQLWTPTAHGAGLLIDTSGLVVTNHKSIGSATSVEVQIDARTKVAGTVVSADPVRGVAAIWINPHVVASLQSTTAVDCTAPAPAVKYGQEVFSVAAPLGMPKDVWPGSLGLVGQRVSEAEFRFGQGATGGPVFTEAGALVGITAPEGDDELERPGSYLVVPMARACEAVADARAKIAAATPPPASLLPVEPPASSAPPAPSPVGAGRQNTNQFKVASADFDITFLTPALVRNGQYRFGGPPDFGYWTNYVNDAPPMLFIRVTPQFEESFWKTLARGAAMTKGVALPPLKSFTSNFVRLRAYCGDTEVTPIHPFVIERPVQGRSVIREGLYAFDALAFGDHCASVRLVMFSEKDPQKGDIKILDAKTLDVLKALP